MKTFKQFVDENLIDEKEVEEAVPIKKKHDISPEAKIKRKKAKKFRLQNKGKIKQQQKKQALKRKTGAYKTKKKAMDKQGKTMGGDKKTTFTNKT